MDPFTEIYNSPQQKLGNSDSQLRILELLPGDEVETVHCNTKVVSLEECPSYTALSYCWGNQSDTMPITFNGAVNFEVTRSLYGALRHLRSRDTSVWLWADALCINQKDDEEKNGQVKMMGEIYRNAKETRIWLGEADHNSDLAMDIVANLDGEDLDSPRNKLNTEGLEALESLQKRPWWSRIWVVQEAVLSKAPKIQCGKKILPIENFERLDDIRRGWHHTNGEYVDTNNSISAYSSTLRNPFSVVITDWAQTRTQIEANELSLGDWANSLRDFEATNPKDKIYGILSLGSNIDRQVIKINYQPSFTVNQLYNLASTWFLSQYRDLIHLQFDQDNKTQSFQIDGNKCGLCSWALDYSMSSPKPDDPTWCRPAYIPFTSGKYQAFGNGNLLSEKIKQPNPFPHKEPKVYALHLRGLRVDSIAFVNGCPHIPPFTGIDPGGKLRYRLQRHQETAKQMATWEAEVLKLEDNGPYSRLPGGSAEAFRRTLMANRGPDWSRLPEEASDPSNARWKHFFEVMMERDQIPEDFLAGRDAMDEGAMRLDYMLAYRQAVIPRTAGRNFVITKQGYFGLAPMGSQPGDTVCVMEGGRVPFILRQIPEKELSEADVKPEPTQFYCRLVGESYVHGVSDGEWIGNRTEEDVVEVIIV